LRPEINTESKLFLLFYAQIKKDALTSLKISLPKAKERDLMRKKCGKEDIHFCRGSAGTVLV
jgi:hypothetical protein